MATAADIKAVQAKLNALGANPPLTVDGAAGPMTQAAVRGFQQANGLTADGIIGPQTMGALGLTPGASSTVPSSSGGLSGGLLGWLNGLFRKPLPAPAGSGVRPVVVQKLPGIFGAWEGAALKYMYTDSKGYVTTGTGNLIDPIGAAIALPWVNSSGIPASIEEVTDAWNTVKGAWPGTQSVACASLTGVRLTQQALDELLMQTVNGYYGHIKGVYPTFDAWPADAQLALLSICWAWGPGFAAVWDRSYPGNLGTAFNNAVNAPKPDFVKAGAIMRQASQIHEEAINPGIIKRDEGTQSMFGNAAGVVAKGLDFNSLVYPSILPAAALASGTIVALAGVGIGSWLAYKEYEKHKSA